MNVPEVALPGFQGLLYDAQERAAGVSMEKKASAIAPATSAAAAPASARQGRSTKQSIAIVVDGPGARAAIGAFAGRATGLIFDRTTTKK